ncbi:dienelactone hydrolase family protein [Tropicimonas sediminicola]|uniref:Dienelactone hydrolase n=1 Tax=Tropicimonas sediminicola TaxID=1031541 RepID=A0A239MAH0_9RHOB|nr:prolyl oligopeptidase family serine peptidase [Tropicimonas sediminicola]SNT39083.1 Dienelactone hydrolase [Tropicimonas sediminicola]
MKAPGRRRLRWLIWGAGAVVVLGLMLAGNTLTRYLGWLSSAESPQAVSGMLAPEYRVTFPDGTGPWPTALLFSGCDGPRDNMDRWAEALAARGWASVIVDSHGPRGYADAQIWRLICAGQLLTGAERAGDVAVAVEDARSMDGVDPDRLLLLGASHGGWAILDMLALFDRGRPPHGLSRWPPSFAEQGLDGIVGAVLFYPYCGAGSQVARFGWTTDVATLFLLVEGDTIANETSCEDLVARMATQGNDVTSLVLDGATHGFDQAEKSAFSLLQFSPEATLAAQLAVERFVERVSPR